MTLPSSFIFETPSRLVLREGGGCLSVFGAPFFLVGASLVYLTLTGHFSQSTSGMSGLSAIASFLFIHVLLLLFALVFAGVGGFLMFARRRVMVDRDLGALFIKQGALGVYRTKVRPFDQFDRITLSFDAGDSDTQDSYPVILDCQDGKPFRLCAPPTYGEARSAASAVAALMGKPCTDRSTDKVVTWRPSCEETGDPATPTIDTTDEVFIPRPVVLKSTVQQEGKKLSLFIPSVFPRGMLYLLLLILGLLAYHFSPLLLAPLDPGFWGINWHSVEDVWTKALVLFFWSIFFLPLILQICFFYMSGPLGQSLDIDGQRVVLCFRSHGKKQTKEITLGDILSIEYHRLLPKKPGSDCVANPFTTPTTAIGKIKAQIAAWCAQATAHSCKVTIKTKEDMVTLGTGLSEPEAKYLCALIQSFQKKAIYKQ